MNSFKRAVVGMVAAAGIAAGTLVGAAPAQAAVPNLQMTGGVYCQFGAPGTPWNKAWSMTRFMRVTARDGEFRNVTLQEVNGATKFKAQLKKNESLTIKTVWFGCFPSSIAGYAISDYAENLTDNAGFWWNFRRIDNPLDRFGAGSSQSSAMSGGGTDVAGVPALPVR
ncbi:hypothetical protein IA539_19800 [Gordonia sp. zg691]|uniref:Uncharacterized protein n=1 Tax=Gordonia jinghuaiqii TaxID=2758710 RepID=A0A7D7RP56_9ACTN|nr:hypothetical protein [Gordonia jinghuaiqii]MBD0863422.1 hypothetical protein [Gordonia jinghuaiqii]MCR5979154.1 hypothetical protein [Gordonia jinghuaiqii]QMT00953.1 hypothetical protein H1R19_19100 [Gordonia jinghuaiqii]